MDLINTYSSSDDEEDLPLSALREILQGSISVFNGESSQQTPLNLDVTPGGDVSSDDNELLQATPVNLEYQEMQDHQVRTVYLVTYSQADNRFTRASFTEAVISCFSSGRANVVQWVCCLEDHEQEGHHFHLALKLDRLRRWLSIKQEMVDRFDVVLNFRDFTRNYHAAWSYVLKDDVNFIQSVDHPPMIRDAPPRTARASAARGEAARGNEGGGGRGKKKDKPVRMSALAFTILIRKEKIKRMLELYSFIKKEEKAGRYQLAEFFHNRKKAKIEEVIANTWDIENADSVLEREKLSRLEIMANYLSEVDCVCRGEWLRLALQTLANNHISREDFSSAVVNLMEHGRSKMKNIYITGEANCGKSFLLLPMKDIFECFVNPPTSTFNWIGVEDAEIIFLNDFRWSPAVIPWEQLLHLLEGDVVKFPTPKNHYRDNIIFKRDSPVFVTAPDEIVSNKSGPQMLKETKMMKKRWNVLSFTYEIPDHEIREMKPCGTCFCKLVLDDNDTFN